MKRFLAVAVIILLIGGCATLLTNPTLRSILPIDDLLGIEQEETEDPIQEDEEQVHETELPQKERTIRNILNSMSMEEKVGQMFFVRCPTGMAANYVSQYHLGGYILFGRDFQDKTVQDVAGTIASYQATADVPLLIGVHEEGGTVVRVSSNPNLFPYKCLSPQALYKDGGMEAIEEDAVTKNTTLLGYGINVNFAPVADVSTDPDDFMYDRAFGQDAQATAEYVKTVVTAMNRVGIGSVLKHFPGYGNNVDTHTGIAVDERPEETFLTSDFLPFDAGIIAGAGAVLVSHNIVNCMDDTLPASLSPEVHRVLREGLGFGGVILTDDLAMDAVDAYAEDGSVAVLAVQAGNDMVVTTDFTEQIPLVITAVENGEIDEAVIDAAVIRILSWKYDLGLLH